MVEDRKKGSSLKFRAGFRCVVGYARVSRAKAEKMLGYKPKLPLEDGLQTCLTGSQ